MICQSRKLASTYLKRLVLKLPAQVCVGKHTGTGKMFSRALGYLLDIYGGDLHNLTICFNTAAAAAFPVSKASEAATKSMSTQQESAVERKKLNAVEEPSWQYVFSFFLCRIQLFVLMLVLRGLVSAPVRIILIDPLSCSQWLYKIAYLLDQKTFGLVKRFDATGQQGPGCNCVRGDNR